MTLSQIALLALIQGAAELLPVSSSAHVIAAEKLMGLDPAAPDMTFFLVMLHTGTMFAVLVYFWKRWLRLFQANPSFLRWVAIATLVTGIVGMALKEIIEKGILVHLLGHSKGEVESLFRVLPLVAASLFVVGIYILFAGKRPSHVTKRELSDRDAASIGLIQALCLPFRGLSRSGATISTALIRGIARPVAEDFSFALAVVLTPPVILLELRRLLKAGTEHPALHLHDLLPLLQPGMIGMVLSFGSGLLALRWLSAWLEGGKWSWFGYYCIVASAAVMLLAWL